VCIVALIILSLHIYSRFATWMFKLLKTEWVEDILGWGENNL